MATSLPASGLGASNSRRLIVETGSEFRVNGAVYTDPEIFRAENDRVFGTTWVYLAHESEIPDPGDYKTSYVGLRPVIVVRGDDGTVRVLLNRCRHRGSVICRKELGNAKEFQCRYHGWLYANDGRLLAIAQHRGAYPADIDKGTLGLFQVPRIETYRGLIFASMNPRVCSLLDHLGPAKRYIDLQFDRSPTGRIDVRYGAHRSEYQGNWKFQAENSIDGYHGDTVHESFWRLIAEFGNKGGRHGAYTQTNLDDILQHRRKGVTMGFENGHGMLVYPISQDALDAMRNGPQGPHLRRIEELHGPDAAKEIFDAVNVLIFPNLALLHGQIRAIRPIAPDRTEVSIQFYGLDDVPDAVNEERLKGYERFFGPSSFGSPDDVEIFAMNQQGLQAKEVEWLYLSRGIERETADNEGSRTGEVTDETPLRSFHRAWHRLMSA
jgi:benzoate/toluate 1,2-dioxygenase alpha subunit